MFFVKAINKFNILLLSTCILLIYIFVLFNSPYYLDHAATDSGYDYITDSLSLYTGQSQINYNHPGLIPILIGSLVIKFFINENFSPQSFINAMSLISYTFLIFSFYFIIKFYRESSFKSIIVYPLCLTCFLWPPLLGSLTSFSAYSFLPGFGILFLVNFLYIYQKRKYNFINFLFLALLSIILVMTHVVTLFLVIFIYFIIFLQIYKEKNSGLIKKYFFSIFLFLIILFTIGLFEPKLIIPVFRMFIQFFWNIAEISLGSTENNIFAKLVYYFIEFRVFFLLITFLSLFIFFFIKFSHLNNSKKEKKNNSTIYILLFLFFFYLTFCTQHGFFVNFDNSFFNFEISWAPYYPKDYNPIFVGLKLSSFIGIFLIFFLISLLEKNKENFNHLNKNKLLFTFLLLTIYITLFFSIINTNNKIKKNYVSLERFYQENSKFINNTFSEYNFIAHDLHSKFLWFGPNSSNFISYNSKKIKPLIKNNYEELSLNVEYLPKIMELTKAKKENLLKRYSAIICDQRYDLLRKPNKIYYIFGNFAKIINDNTCAKLLDFSLYYQWRFRINEFVSGKRFGLKPKYLLLKKEDYYFELYNLENNKFSTVVYSYEDILNEIGTMFEIKNYEITKFRTTTYIAIELK